MKAGRIPDPFIGMNEKSVQWVHDKDWVYTCTFHAEKIQHGEEVALCFEGLDTYATVYLNNHKILEHVPLSVHLLIYGYVDRDIYTEANLTTDLRTCSFPTG